MAQTPGIINGSIIGIYVGSTKILNGKSISFSIKMATRDTTNSDTSGYKTALGGLLSWDMSGDYLFAEDASYGFDDIFGLITARAAVTVKISSEVVGDKLYTGSAFITSLDREGSTEENVTFKVSFEGTGALTESTKS